MGRQTKEQQDREAQERLQQAIACKRKHKLQDAPPVAASCAVLGNKYGVGIGLYFQIIAWLRYLLFWLALCMVPFMIVINTTRFTTPEHKGEAGSPGMSTLPSFNILQSLTFAVMPDDAVDHGLLSWMNIQLPGIEGVFPMSRLLFLAWISLMDAGSMAVFSVACLVLYKLASRFAKAVDQATMEVSDYTVLVKGLPETTPIDIGHHFSKWGRVVDVVIVKDFGPLMNLAATATSLEQQRKAAQDKVATGRRAAARQHRIKKLERKMVSFMQQASKQLDSSGFVMKACFVTFNTECQAEACLSTCPRRWLSSWLLRRKDRFLNKYRFWVERAKPPEDYIYENLSVPRVSRYIRMGIVRLVVFAILLASAGAVTKLMAMNMEAARSLAWSDAAMDGMIDLDMRVYPLNGTEVLLAPAAASATLARVAAAVGSQAATQLAANSYDAVAYCSVNLEQACSNGLGGLLGADLLLQGAQGVTWANLTDALLKREQFLQLLPGCSKPGSGCTSLAMCYPCHCSLLSKVAPAKVAQSDGVLAMRQECGGFIETVDMHAYIMKGLISVVLVVLNFVLKSVLHLLVDFEKHWTQSDKERAYAVLAFVSQLLNSVLVLLLVNAQSSIASKAINGALSSGTASRYTSWGTNLILSGAYMDFSPSWYTDVGQSLQLLIIINAVVTGAFTLAMWVKRKLHQCCLTSYMQGASQSAWNAAWIGMEFVLDARVSDIMLGLWIILMFGSGLPSLYVWGLIWLLVVEVTDRWSLARICQTPARYGKSLPFLLLGILPWAAATHCAFGLWMHTYFQAGHVGDAQISGLASNAGAAAQALTNTYYFRRVTQNNGLPLLVLLIVHLGIHVFIRFMLYFFGKAFIKMCGCCCSHDDETDCTQEGVTYEAALLERYAQMSSSGAASKGPASKSHSAPTVALAGAPTYRLPHHPRYSEIFSNPLYKPVWFKAMGRLRYTTLLSRPGGGFIITPEPMLDHDDNDLAASLSNVSSDLQAMALRMADDKGVEGGGKRKRQSGLLTEELKAMRERSMSVQVAVLAGLGLDSPRGSFTGPTSAFGSRHKSTDLAGLATADPTSRVASASLMAGPISSSSASLEALTPSMAPGSGSFTMSGAPMQSRLSCPGQQGSNSVYAAVAADLAAGALANTRSTAVLAPSHYQGDMTSADPPHDTVLAEQSPQHQQSMQDGVSGLTGAFAVGPDGCRVPLVPVFLPEGGIACYPADKLPEGAVVALPTGNTAANTLPEASVTLSGGIGAECVEVQLPQSTAEQLEQGQQYESLQLHPSPDQQAAAGLDSVRQQAYLQRRAEAIFGHVESPSPQSAPAGFQFPAGDHAGSTGVMCFAEALPFPPTSTSSGPQGSWGDQQQNMVQQQHLMQQQQQQQQAYPAHPEAAAIRPLGPDHDSHSSTQQSDPAAGTQGLVVSSAAPEPGWMCDSMPNGLLLSCHLWDGALAAANHAQGAGAPVPDMPGSELTMHTTLQPAQHAAGLVASAGGTGAGFYPNIHLFAAEPPLTYPNIHLTTVEMPVGFAAPAAVEPSSSSFSTALLAGSSRVLQACPGDATALLQQQLHAPGGLPQWLLPQELPAPAAAPADAGAGPVTAARVGFIETTLAVQAEEAAPLSPCQPAEPAYSSIDPPISREPGEQLPKTLSESATPPITGSEAAAAAEPVLEAAGSGAAHAEEAGGCTLDSSESDDGVDPSCCSPSQEAPGLLDSQQLGCASSSVTGGARSSKAGGSNVGKKKAKKKNKKSKKGCRS